jgi:hypothetical protein
VVDLGTALLLTLLAMLFLGWAEDLAARRAPRWWPSGPRALQPEEVLAEREPVTVTMRQPEARSYRAAAALSRRPGGTGPRSAPDPAAGRHAAPEPLAGEIVEAPDWFRS